MLPARDRINEIIVYASKADMLANTDGTLFDTGISSGTGRIEHPFFNELPAFGACNSAMFECEVSINADLTGKWIRVRTKAYATDVATTRTSYWSFAGKVDSCRKDVYADYRKLVAYDEINYLRSVDIGDWWSTYWATAPDTDLDDFLEDACEQFDVELDSNLTLRNVCTMKAEAQRDRSMAGCSFVQLLEYVGEVSAMYFYIDATGVLTASYLSKTTNVLALDSYIDTKHSTLGDDVSETFGSVLIYQASSQIYSDGNSEPAYVIRDNPLIDGMDTTELMDIFENHLDYVQDASGVYSGNIELIVSSLPDFSTARCVSIDSHKYFASRITVSGTQMIDMTLQCSTELSSGGTYKLYESQALERVATIDRNMGRNLQIIADSLESLRTTFSAMYTALENDLNEYKVEANTQIQQNALGIEENFTFTQNQISQINSTLTADGTAIENQGVTIADTESWRQITEAYIKTGLLYYDNGVEVVGIAIGQLTYEIVNGNKVIKRDGFYATYTGSDIVFYKGTTEVARYSDFAAIVNELSTRKIVMGNFVIDTTDGRFTIK